MNRIEAIEKQSYANFFLLAAKRSHTQNVNPTQTCVAGAIWSPSASCTAIAKYCPALTAVAPMKSVGYSPPDHPQEIDSTATFECSNGWSLVGSATLV
jgi:hypothetical protein